MKLEGTLDVFPLRELIDMVTYSSVTGAINIYGRLTGSIYFIDGRLTHAACGSAVGQDALEEMFVSENGHFTFVSDTRVEEETIWGDALATVGQAEQMAMRRQQVSQWVPDADLAPRLLVSADALQSLSPAEAKFGQLANGSNTLRQIAAQLRLGLADASELAADMVRNRAIAFPAAVPTPNIPVPNETSQQSAQPRSAGMFERIASKSH